MFVYIKMYKHSRQKAKTPSTNIFKFEILSCVSFIFFHPDFLQANAINAKLHAVELSDATQMLGTPGVCWG